MNRKRQDESAKNAKPANGLLAGVRVIDLTRVLAGPYCTMMLGDLGADVIKIEIPGRGDDTRQWGPPFTESGESAYFISANRNKRSMTLDLKSTRGQEILKALIGEADILVENFRSGTLDRWGLDYPALQELRPGLIYCSITGYGHTGPYKDRPGYDFIAQALSGFMSITGPVEGEPIRAGVAIADLASGIFAFGAIMAALYAREVNGEGQQIDISLLDSQVAMMSYVASNFLISGEAPRRYGNAHPNIVPYEVLQAADGYMAFAAGNDGQWRTFCEAIGKDAWLSDERFATNPARTQNRGSLIPLLNELFRERSIADWTALCEQIGLPAAGINDMAAVFKDPQVKAREMQVDHRTPEGENIPMVASPLKIPTNPARLHLGPPRLGEHTEAVLTERLGYDVGTIEELRREQVI